MIAKKTDEFIKKLQRGTVSGSYNTAVQTLEIMRAVVASSKWASAQELINDIKEYSARLKSAKPLEVAIGNMALRVLYIVREEYLEYTVEEEAEDPGKPGVMPLKRQASMIDFLEGEGDNDGFTKTFSNLKTRILEGITAEIEDIGGVYVQIAEQALEHIHANEVILTFGKSRTVAEFLKAAGAKRKFEVLVADSAPSYYGHSLAKELAESGIQTTLITDSAVFALMARGHT